MTSQDEEKWHRLCQEAMHEKDVNKLLQIFLELDHAMESGKRMELLSGAVREYQQAGLSQVQQVKYVLHEE
jgi:Trp operon repressor